MISILINSDNEGALQRISTYFHTQENCQFTLNVSRLRQVVSTFPMLAHMSNLESTISAPVETFWWYPCLLIHGLPGIFVPWFGENIWIDDEHCPYWDVVKSKSGVLPKRIYPTRTNWNPSFASVWCSWKKKCCQAHKLQTALWGVFEAGVPARGFKTLKTLTTKG